MLTNITYDKKGRRKILDNVVPQNYLYNGLSIKVKPKTTNAIVGYSGFGKTTLLNIMVSTNIISYNQYQILTILI